MSPPTNVTHSKGKTQGKKEKVFHPQSRKAGQLQRAQLRKSRLALIAIEKSKKEAAKADKFVFFYHAIPPDASAVTLATLHGIVRDVWLKRHDIALQAEKSARRKGRPKTGRQMMLEEIMLRDVEDYRTGLEVPDITHPPNVALFRRWGQTGVGFIDLLRFIRINSEDPTSVVVSRPGGHQSLLQLEDMAMEDTTASSRDKGPVLNSPHKFASTMQTMDDGPAVTAVDRLNHI